MSFVPDGFTIPEPPVPASGAYRLEPLGPQHNASDLAAWTSSIDFIHALPGWSGADWPPLDGMAPAQNLSDLEGHARDFAERTGFTYTVLDGDTVVGCVYIYPDRDDPAITSVRSWVTADHARLDKDLYLTVARWLADAWPFTRLRYAAR